MLGCGKFIHPFYGITKEYYNMIENLPVVIGHAVLAHSGAVSGQGEISERKITLVRLFVRIIRENKYAIVVTRTNNEMFVYRVYTAPLPTNLADVASIFTNTLTQTKKKDLEALGYEVRILVFA